MPYISKSFIDKLEEEADLVQIINSFVDDKLKRAGSVFKAKSPFTKERTASFTVTPTKGIWKDFSSGKGGTSAIQFVMQYTRSSYPEAVEAIAKELHLEVQYDDSKQAKAYVEKQKKKAEALPVLVSSINSYHKLFLELPDDHEAKREVYLKRGYTLADVKKYQIGYAPGEGKFLYDLCKENGVKDIAEKIGLINKYGDRFRNRVIYPISAVKGMKQVYTGIAGRDLTNSKKAAKWMNSSDSILYDKSLNWYGLEFAKEAIVKSNEAYLVEGYNDVIGFHKNDLENTISSCGTSITPKQIAILRKLCDKVIICLDPDKAGINAAIKIIPEFLAAGFRVEILELPDVDPDDFCRVYKKELTAEKEKLSKIFSDFVVDGFKLLIDYQILNTQGVLRSQNTKTLCETISRIPDDAIQTIYSGWLAQESNVKLTDIKKWIKEAHIKNTQVVLSEKANVAINGDGTYVLPPNVKESIEDLRPIIEKYSMFQANNQIWMQVNFEEPPFRFKSVSNFSIDIIQHMQDEKFPMKLIRICNIFNKETIFDIQSEAMNTPMAFDNAVTAHGNFLWKGGRNEHQKLRQYLFDRMGTGRKIDVLGWQPEGFWCWQNKVTIPKEKQLEINKNGVFKHKDVSYYVPSANEIYKNNPFKYEAQKKIKSIKPSCSFNNYAIQMIKVHRNHAITGLLFTIASMFQDIVVASLGNFPILFLYGPASSGKDQLADSCQSFFGHPQTAINLEGGVSTIKAQVREFAQFSNIICHLSEYKNGDPKLDGVLKGLWDRRGYKRGNIDSHVGTESIPILSSVILTGNYTPDSEALITRLVWEEMNKTMFNDEEVAEYDKLADMTKNGLSEFTDHILEHRDMVKTNFKRVFREMKATLGERLPEGKSRMISNTAVLCSFYQMFQNVVEFPFSLKNVMDHFQKGIDIQTRKLNSASKINRWWDCFLASMRGTVADQLRVERDFKIEGDRLYFQFTSCYNKIQRQWWTQYHDSAPGKTMMIDAIRKEPFYIEDVKSIRMSSGRSAVNTSACVVDLNQLEMAEEIKFAVDFQKNENTLFENPATQEKQNNNEEFDFLKDM